MQQAIHAGVEPNFLLRFFRRRGEDRTSPTLDKLEQLDGGPGVTVAQLLSPGLKVAPVAPPEPPVEPNLAKQVGRLVENFLARRLEEQGRILSMAAQAAEESAG